MSALPPKADMCDALAHVRFVPKVDSCSAVILSLFDHLVGAADQRLRDIEAESFGSLEIYDQLNLG